MANVAQSRLVPFWIADINSQPISNYTLASLSITFTRNGQPCSDALVLVNNGGGSYALSYTPSGLGLDQINIDDSTNDLHYCDIEEILSPATPGSDAVMVTQDYGGTGVLLPSVPNRSSFTLYAFLSSDWNVGNSDPSYAAGSYQLDDSGDWSLELLAGTYTLVLMDGTGTVIVFEPTVVVAVSGS
jgi:hypothetical protein